MAEELKIDRTAGKADKYQALLPQVEALIGDEPNRIANMANVAAALKQAFNFFWVGFYLVEGDSLVLGPFQGPVACTRIAKGKGVCGAAWATRKSLIVPDVEAFPGHIACSSESKSEIVVPGVGEDGKVHFVLDLDSDRLNDFDEVDQQYLERMVNFMV